MFKDEIKNELRTIYMDNKEIDKKITEIKVALHNLEKLGFDITELYKLQEQAKLQNKKIKANNEKILDVINNIEKIEKTKNLLKINFKIAF